MAAYLLRGYIPPTRRGAPHSNIGTSFYVAKNHLRRPTPPPTVNKTASPATGFSRNRLPYVLIFFGVGCYLIGRYFWVDPTVPTTRAIGFTAGIMLFASILMVYSRTLFFFIGLAILGAFLNGESGFALSGLGAFLWVLGGLIAFLVTLSYYARYIAPPLNRHQNETTWLGFVLLMQHALREWRVELRPIRHVPRNIPPSFTAVKAGEIPTHQAYAIFRGQKFLRAVGPGYVLLQRRLRIQAIVDVRTQSRMQKFQATTRDGIPVDTSVRVGFHVFRSQQEAEAATGAVPEPAANADERRPFPYWSRAIMKLQYGIAVHQEKHEVTVHPYTQVLPRAVIYATEFISEKKLDELLDMDAEELALTKVSKAVQAKLQAYFVERGLKIASVKVTPLILPEKVQEARLNAWRGSWKRPVDERLLGMGIRPLSKEMAEDQIEVIKDLMSNFELLSDVGQDLPMRNEIMARVQAVITDAATEGLIESLLPPAKK